MTWTRFAQYVERWVPHPVSFILLPMCASSLLRHPPAVRAVCLSRPVRIRAGVDGDLGPYRDPPFGLACTRHFRDGMSLSYPARFRPRALFLRNVGRLLALCDIMSRSGGRLALCDIWHDQYLGRAESAASLGTSRRQDAPADDTGESTH